MEHMGIQGSASCLLPLTAGIPTFLLPQRNVAALGHYSSAVTFSLVLVGRQFINTDHASCSVLPVPGTLVCTTQYVLVSQSVLVPFLLLCCLCLHIPFLLQANCAASVLGLLFSSCMGADV